ncbi:hypothetical protein [Rhizobium rhizogenes]|uniref:hypothetical protein n=1 Tax=Rhizobium rhizogenes TaxID=359 RepID=UPI001574C96E|nr:hypothetical protein [Rhizobium rhizogenes]NTG07110.1 hypothetical protein [Rhizobium rhizogenes]
MSKHTPGPWEVEDPMGAEIGLSIVQAGLKTYEWEFIAMVCQSTAGDELMGRQRFISPKEQEANACLIAAAPELLECLKDARRLLSDQEAIDLVHLDEVIAKAEGRS